MSTRNERLAELDRLTKMWADSRKKQYQARVDMLNKLVKGRGAGQLANASVQAASQLVVEKLTEFLVG